jgi:hypothetical protein
MMAKSCDKETDSMYSPARSIRRTGQLASAAAALALAALVVTPSAGAATLYACVNKRTGAARLFSYKPRCKRGQARLSWNTEGPAGKNGANGKNGATGKNGSNGKNGTNGTNGTSPTINGYSATKSEYTEFTVSKEAPAVILTKSLNAGNYILSAKTVLSATANAPTRAAAACELIDGGPALDTSGWDAPLAEDSGKLIGETTLSLEAAVSLKATTVISLVCTDLSPAENELKIGAASSQIVAVQTTQNG